MQFGVGGDVRQVLPLKVGERRTHWLTHGCAVIPLYTEGADECTVPRVDLEEREREQLRALVAGASRAARRITRAQILLAADAGCADDEIARAVQVGTSTVYRTKRRFVEESPEAALST